MTVFLFAARSRLIFGLDGLFLPIGLVFFGLVYVILLESNVPSYKAKQDDFVRNFQFIITADENLNLPILVTAEIVLN